MERRRGPLACPSLEHENVCPFEDEFAPLIVKSDCKPQNSSIILFWLDCRHSEFWRYGIADDGRASIADVIAKHSHHRVNQVLAQGRCPNGANAEQEKAMGDGRFPTFRARIIMVIVDRV